MGVLILKERAHESRQRCGFHKNYHEKEGAKCNCLTKEEEGDRDLERHYCWRKKTRANW
jgi:hypothetical protein